MKKRKIVSRYLLTKRAINSFISKNQDNIIPCIIASITWAMFVIMFFIACHSCNKYTEALNENTEQIKIQNNIQLAKLNNMY